ncbi:MFS transporter [Nocardiopsis ansamitocini]|uniref:MFS transporter n=1 Tax=Nocardiopsis ansamitocini TaxID=1670832 RepID=A0A9W6P9R4_9ACTN|nr:MFS transporter [Nocardiopsis ansamitocini]GLU50245.1 MFS transporter [Nocardiopsis ansamitocini]
MPTYLDFVHANRRRLSGGFLLFFLSSFGQTFFISFFADDIRAEHGLSHGEFGALFMVATLVGALSLTRLGAVVDRYRASTVVLVAIGALVLGAVTMALATHLLLLLLALFVLRLFGQGMLAHTSFTLMGRWFDRERGRATTVATLGLNTGEALLPLVVVVVTVTEWRQAWWLAAVALLLSLWPAASLLGDRPGPGARADGSPPRSVRHWTRGEALRDPYFPLLAAALAAPALIGNTVFFHQLYLGGLRGWDSALFASAFTVYAAATVGANLVGGHLVDRFTALRMVPVYLLPLGCGLLVLAAVGQSWSVFVFMALYGVTNGLSLTVFGAVWPEVYGVRHLGGIRSVVTVVLVFVSAAGPGAAGLLIDAGVSYPGQVAVLGGYCLAASAVMVGATGAVRARARTWSAQ